MVVARGVVLPRNFRHSDVAAARRLDVARWYAAQTGRPWDGLEASFAAARDASSRMRRRRPSFSADVPTPGTPATYPFRHAHLLVEPAADVAAWSRLVEFTEIIGWPDAFDCGHLAWQRGDGLQCAFCEALLLPSEAESVQGAPLLVRGKHCCAEG